MSIPARESRLDLSDERLGHGALCRRGRSPALNSLFTDLLDQGCVWRAERGVSDGGGASLPTAAEERVALLKRHEEMLASKSFVVQLLNAASRVEVADNYLSGRSGYGATCPDSVAGLRLLAGDPVLVAIQVSVCAIERVAALERCDWRRGPSCPRGRSDRWEPSRCSGSRRRPPDARHVMERISLEAAAHPSDESAAIQGAGVAWGIRPPALTKRSNLPSARLPRSP